MLDVKVVRAGENSKFVSKYHRPYRVIKVYGNNTVDIADNSYAVQRVHVNRLKPLFESMLWRDEAREPYESPFEPRASLHRTIGIQTESLPEEKAGRANESEASNLEFPRIDIPNTEQTSGIELPERSSGNRPQRRVGPPTRLIYKQLGGSNEVEK